MSKLVVCVALGTLLVSPALAEERVEQHVYRVHHALFGDVGTLSHVIRTDGAAVQVSTRAEVRVRALGVTLHHMRLAWDENWQAGGLQDFRGTTIRNGNTTMVHAWAEDGHVTIATGARIQQAPAGVRPINPWSLQLLRAAALMSPETGTIVPLPVADRGTEPLRLATGETQPVHHYTLGANQLYFDVGGTLVKSEYADITGAVTFTLLDTADRNLVQASISP